MIKIKTSIENFTAVIHLYGPDNKGIWSNDGIWIFNFEDVMTKPWEYHTIYFSTDDNVITHEIHIEEYSGIHYVYIEP